MKKPNIQKEKTIKKILNLNKNTMKTFNEVSMSLCVIKILAEYYQGNNNFMEILRPCIFLVIMIYVNYKLYKCKTFDEIEFYFFAFLTIVQTGLEITLFVGCFYDNLFSSVKAFYKLTGFTCLILGGKFTLENKGADKVYYGFMTSLLITTFLLLITFPLSEVKDEFVGIIVILMISRSNYNSSNIYFDTFKKLLVKNEINIERYDNIIQNLKACFISINITNFEISTNNSFKSLVEFIKSDHLHDGFFNYSKESLTLFKNNYYNSEDFIYFLDEYQFKNVFNASKLNPQGNNKLSEKKIYKIIKFFKQLYYLTQILENLEVNGKEVQAEVQVEEALPNFSKIFTSEFFQKDEKFANFGNFVLINKSSNKRKFYGVTYLKSIVSGIELIDIMINDNTNIILAEEERADTKYRKSYLSNVAHEFKAPIQILLISVIDLSKVFFTKEAQKLYKDIENLGNYILILIMDIISFSKEDKGLDVKFEAFDIKSPFDFGLEVLQLLIKNNNNKCFSIKPRLIIDGNIPKIIKSDETRIKQVVVNLITNAYKFTMSGEIIIRVSLILTSSVYDEILVSVEDSGIGIKPADADKLFKRFGKLEDRLDLNRQGTGLGLTICQNIVDRIGIQIGYQNKENGSGSIFYFSFLNLKDDNICAQLEQDKCRTFKSIKLSSSSLGVSRNNLEFNCDDKEMNDNKSIAVKKKISNFFNIDYYEDKKIMKNMMTVVNINEKAHNALQDQDIEYPYLEYKYVNPKSNLNITHLEKENQGLFTFREKSSKISNNNLLNIPDEAFEYYRITSDDSMFSDEKAVKKEENLDKRSLLFKELFNLVQKYSKHEQFEKIYHNFKPYIKFLIESLRNINKKVVNTLIVDDNSLILKTLKNLIKTVVKGKTDNYGIIKAYDGVEALALFKIDFFLNKSFKNVISDQNMSLMHGIHCFEIMKKCLKNEKYLNMYLSTADEDNFKDSNIKYVSLLSKPVSKKALSKLFV